MKKLLTILLLFVCLTIQATDKYIATAANGGNNSNSGAIGSPWLTLTYACANTSSGDVIHITAGTYVIPYDGQGILKAGVSIIGVMGHPRASIIHSDVVGFVISAITSGSGNATGQSISYVRFEGDSDYSSLYGIEIRGRSNVSVHHCEFEDFYKDACVFSGLGSGDRDQVPPTFYAADCSFYNNTVTDCAAATWSGGTPGFNGSGALLIGGTLRMRIYNDTLTQPYRGAGVNGWLIKYIAGGWDKGLEIFNNVITKPFYTDDYWKFSCEIWNTRGGFKFYNNTVEGELDMGGSTYLNNDEGEYGFTYKIYNNTFGPATAPARYSDGVQFETGLTGGAYVYNNLFRNLYVGLSMTQNANLIKTVPLVFQDVYVSYNIFKDVGIAGDGWGILSYCAAVTDGGTAIVDNINFDNNTFYSAAFTPRAAIKFQTQATNTNIRIRNNIIQGFAYCFESSGVTPTNGTIDNLYLQNNINYGNGNSNNPYYNGLTPSNVTVSDTLKRNPKFITPGSDFHLQATSPARDAGINVGQTHDYGNNNVPFGSRFDIGALEYIDDVVIYPPVVNLSNITSYTAISATTGGTVTDDGGGTVSERGICWSTSMYPTVYDDTIRLGSGTGTFTGTITGLLGSTMYHVRGYAINELGYDSAGYGFDVGFTTLNYPVVVVSASILMSDGKVVILKGTTSLPPVTPPAGTQNLVKYSEELDGDVNDAWAFTNLTVTNNQDYDLAGGLTLEKLTITDATHIIGYTDYYDGTSHYFTTVPGTTYRFSWDVKQGTMTDMKWSVLDRTHDVEIIAPTSYYFRTSSSVQRVSLEFTAPTGCTSVFLYMLRNSGATGTVYMGRIQMESNGSIYIKTTSAIITP